MMTKIKSGLTAKLKLILIVPFALALFFLFADLTVKGPNTSISNFISLENKNEIPKFYGMWENTGSNDYAQLISFSKNKFSVLENTAELKEFEATMDKEHIMLNMWTEETPVSYEFKNNELIIWWSKSGFARYKKSETNTSLEHFIGSMGSQINLPSLNEYKVITGSNTFSLVFMKGKLTIGDQAGTLSDLDKFLAKQKSEVNILDLSKLTVMLYIDAQSKMHEVDLIFLALRKQNFLKIVYVGNPQENSNSALLAHAYGRPFKLPPMDPEIVIEEELVKDGIKLFKMYCEISVEEEKEKLKTFLAESKKYVTPLYYSDGTAYSEYLAYIDMVFSVVYDFREDLAKETFKTDYSNLSSDQQENIRKRYPLIIMSINTDSSEFGKK